MTKVAITFTILLRVFLRAFRAFAVALLPLRLEKPLAFAFLQLLASCQTAAVVANPPTTAATQPEKTFSICPTSVSPATSAGESVYTSSPAPATVHVDALNLTDHPNDWLAEKYAWDFGDPNGPTINANSSPSIKLNNALQGPVAAYQYQSPGTYTIKLTRILATGQMLICTAKLIVPPSHRTVFYIAPDGSDTNPGTDPHHPLRSAGEAIKLVADHTEFRFRRGAVYTFEPEFSVKHSDILIDSYGDANLPLPVLLREPPTRGGAAGLSVAAEDCLTFTTWPGMTANVTIQNLRVDSHWTPTATAGHYAYHAPAVTFGILRGDNITVANCEFANLVEGPHGDPTANGLLFLNNHQVDPLGIPSRTLWLEGREVVAIGNHASNSVNESPLRAASTGIIGGLIAFNTIAQQLDPAHDRASAKAAVTLRTMSDVAVMNNQITNAEFSFDPHSNAALDQRILVANNTVTNSMIDIKTNVRHATFRNNKITRDGGPCITINPGSSDAGEWIEDLQLQNNTGQGWLDNARMLQINPYGENQLRQFVCDPAKNVFTKIAGPMP